jgi:hypothetical protein
MLRSLVWEDCWVLDEATGCKVWIRARSKAGYGQLRLDGKTAYAHRLAWEREVGPIPKGQWLLHRCDNPACVNVAHLFLGTQADNMADMRAKERHRGPYNRGGASTHQKLRRCEVEEIRRLCSRGLRQWLVGRMFRINQAHVSAIVRGVIWAP